MMKMYISIWQDNPSSVWFDDHFLTGWDPKIRRLVLVYHYFLPFFLDFVDFAFFLDLLFFAFLAGTSYSTV